MGMRHAACRRSIEQALMTEFRWVAVSWGLRMGTLLPAGASAEVSRLLGGPLPGSSREQEPCRKTLLLQLCICNAGAMPVMRKHVISTATKTALATTLSIT